MVGAIVEAAARVLELRGYARTTTNEIAARAGVSVGSLYEYFKDKQAVLDAVMAAHLDAGERVFLKYAQELTASEPPLDVLIAALARAMIELHADRPRLHRVLSTEVPRSRATAARLDALEARSIEFVRRSITGHREVRVEDVALAAQVVVQAADALAHRWMVDARHLPVAPATLERELTRLISAYLRSGGGVERSKSRGNR
jgi:AcrR family transcriptional regulator